jgi:hypothetical protein
MSDLWRDFWIRETGTGQQVAQLHDWYMIKMNYKAHKIFHLNLNKVNSTRSLQKHDKQNVSDLWCVLPFVTSDGLAKQLYIAFIRNMFMLWAYVCVRIFFINLFSNPAIFLTYSVLGERDREMSSDHIHQEVFLITFKTCIFNVIIYKNMYCFLQGLNVCY